MSSEKVLSTIRAWEKQWKTKQPNDFERVYDQWISSAFERMNPNIKNRFFTKLDDILFHTHAFLQGSTFQNEARERILASGRLYDSEIERMEEMRKLSIDQLTYLGHQHISKSKLYSFTQGGLTGTGGFLFLGLDFPLMMAINLRAIQLIGLTFGYEMNNPYEMMLSLKVFHAATMPKRLQLAAWTDLKKELNQEQGYLYEGKDEFTDETWIEQPLKQALKSLFILMFRKKLMQGIPVLSMVIGAGLNYQLTKQVTDFALRFYQYRNLLDTGQIDE